MHHRIAAPARAFVAGLSLSTAMACGSAGSGPRPLAAQSDAGAAGGGAPAAASGGAVASVGGASFAGTSAAGTSALGEPATLPVVPEGGLVAPDDPHLRYLGRWVRTAPKRPIASWGPVAVELRFEGPSLSVELEDEGVDLGAEGRGNVYQVSIDHGAPQLINGADAKSFELASGLAPGEHHVALVRRTESKWGKTTLGGFHLAPGARVLEPGPGPAHRIEVFGDSISAGLANENSGYYTNQTENGYAAFGPVLARKLDSEWRVEARGGGSFYNDFWLPMVPYFARAFGPANMEQAPAADNPPWSFADWQPDVLIVALGTNDFSEQYPHIDEAAYVQKYQAFLKSLRGYYPKAEVLCLSPFKPGAPWDEARAYIPKAASSLGDAHVRAIDPAQSSTWLTAPDDYVAGDAFHPNLAGHEKLAKALEAIVRQDLGW